MRKSIPIAALCGLISLASLGQEGTDEPCLRSTAEAEALVESVMQVLADGEYPAAFELLKPYWPIPGSEIDMVAMQTVQQRGLATSRFGDNRGFERVEAVFLADSLLRLTYLERLERTALRWRFLFYRAESSWLVNSVVWDDQLLSLSPPGEASAGLDANKDLVRRFTEATNAADWDALAEVVADDFERHSAASPGPPVTSRSDFVALQETFLESFPDQRVTLERLVAEGDRVAVLATYSATLSGPMGDFPATGQATALPFLAIFRIEAGRIAELWIEWDNMAMLTQLGLLPPPATKEG